MFNKSNFTSYHQDYNNKKSLSIYNRIGFKIAAIAALGILVVGFFSVLYMSGNTRKVINQVNTDRSQMALTTMNSILEEYKEKSKNAATNLASNDSVIRALEGGQGDSITAAATQTIKDLGLDIDFVTFTDNKGNVIARTHSTKAGDSIVNQQNISMALNGETTTQTDLGTEVKLAIRTGTPVTNSAGQLVGIVSTGYSLANTTLLDKLKSMTGNEFTIFLGDERLNTTIIKDGNRVVGTKLDSKISNIVLNKQTDYLGKADILGASYATAYMPILDSNNNAIGIYFAGIPLASVNKVVVTASITSVIIELLLMAAVIAILSFLVRQMIARPLADMSTMAKELSKGNLNVELSYRAHDELGILSDALRTTAFSLQSYIQDISDKLGQLSRGDMRVHIDLAYIGDFSPIKSALIEISSSLGQMLSQFHHAADQVNLEADQVSKASQMLASGASEQAASVEELNASITNVANQASHNAGNVKKATDYVLQAGKGVEESNQQMQKLNQAMSEIQAASKKITSITKVIDEIAFQTNLLALNAAVEAARAGSAGKGFAVVADEVRNLAAKSAEAAKKTTELIGQSSLSVLEGKQLAVETAKVLEEVSKKTKLVVEEIKQIDLASSEQAEAIEQINLGLNQVATVVQTNAASAEESSTSSEELAAQAQTLNAEIAKFKL